jgi:hypothetical protein
MIFLIYSLAMIASTGGILFFLVNIMIESDGYLGLFLSISLLLICISSLVFFSYLLSQYIDKNVNEETV